MMKKYYLRSVVIILVSTFSLAACQEKEDIVTPEETCDTMAKVQTASGGGIQLVLENGQILVPANANTVVGAASASEFEMDGFKVKEGQQVIIGYQVANAIRVNGISAKVVHVNCVVGIFPKPADL